jgi:hypothetical protein
VRFTALFFGANRLQTGSSLRLLAYGFFSAFSLPSKLEPASFPRAARSIALVPVLSKSTANYQSTNVFDKVRMPSMFLYYLDESYDPDVFVLTAIRIKSERWGEAFELTKQFRRILNAQYGLYISKELHATEFVRGSGRYGPKDISKFHRSQIFCEILRFITTIPEIEIMNVRIAVPGCPVDPHLRAFERLLNRIEKSLSEHGTEGLLILDEGKEGMLRRIARQMSAINYIPSQYGAWEDGKASKNITVKRLVEDPLFKASHSSYFLQLADAVAYSLLKQEVKPTSHVTKYQLNQLFPILKPVLCLKASPRDPQGVVRG